MDPIELLALCKRGAYEGAPKDLIVPQLFSTGEFDVTWRREPTRVRALLDELLCGPFPGDGLELLLKSGAMHALFPELVAIKNLGGGIEYVHKDVWEHTKAVVAGVPANVEMRWSALMHDIGKARTRRVYANGKVTFHNHDVVGAQMVDRLEDRLSLFRDSSSLHTTVRALVLNHLRPASYKKEWTDSGVRRLLTDLGGMRNFDRLMLLSRSDLTTKNPAKRARAQARADELEARVRLIYSEDNAPRLPKGTMGEVLKKVAARPGAWCNVVRDELESMMSNGLLEPDKDVAYYVAAALRLVEEKAYA